MFEVALSRAQRANRLPLTSLVILNLSKDQFRLSLQSMRDYFVYILSNAAQVLYVGMTNDLDVRIFSACPGARSIQFCRPV
jgi:hypothetical protein